MGWNGQIVAQYFHKGDPILIEGRLKLDQWQDQDGQNRSRLKVVAENFQFVASRPQISPRTKLSPQADPHSASIRQAKRRSPATAAYGEVNGCVRRATSSPDAAMERGA